MRSKDKKNINAEVETASDGTKAARKGMPIFKILIAFVLLVVLFYFGFTCEVREGSCAVILRFGAVREEITEAGLYLKLPWPFETVVTYDNRLQYFESNYLEPLTKDKRTVIIKSFVVWEIADPVLYHNSVGSQGKADSYINDQIFGATNSVMGSYELTDLVSLDTESIKTEEIQTEIHERVREKCLQNYGINIMDTSFLRISLPDTTLEAVFAQMVADRQKDIETILKNAELEAGKITNDADIEANEIIGAGTEEAAAIKAQTEQEVNKIYTEAYEENIELFQFLKNLDTVIGSVGDSTVLVVKADEYPFNVLTKYGDYITDEGDETIIKDLNYILTRLPAEDRESLITAIGQLIEAAAADGGIQK